MKFNPKFLFHILCPTRCACCGRVIHFDEEICAACAKVLPHVTPNTCPTCGQSKKECVCSARKRTRFPCLYPFFYEGTVKQGLLVLKDGTAHSADFFGKHMAKLAVNRLGDHFDGIVYVPMTERKLRQRGYNQSRLLAKTMGKLLNLPVLDNALVKLYDTDDQHDIHFADRKGNVFGVFEADRALVAGKHLLLVDDIITTGATLDECGKMLLLADCEEVCGITAASTKYNKEEGPLHENRSVKSKYR